MSKTALLALLRLFSRGPHDPPRRKAVAGRTWGARGIESKQEAYSRPREGKRPNHTFRLIICKARHRNEQLKERFLLACCR